VQVTATLFSPDRTRPVSLLRGRSLTTSDQFTSPSKIQSKQLVDFGPRQMDDEFLATCTFEVETQKKNMYMQSYVRFSKVLMFNEIRKYSDYA